MENILKVSERIGELPSGCFPSHVSRGKLVFILIGSYETIWWVTVGVDSALEEHWLAAVSLVSALPLIASRVYPAVCNRLNSENFLKKAEDLVTEKVLLHKIIFLTGDNDLKLGSVNPRTMLLGSGVI